VSLYSAETSVWFHLPQIVVAPIHLHRCHRRNGTVRTFQLHCCGFQRQPNVRFQQQKQVHSVGCTLPQLSVPSCLNQNQVGTHALTQAGMKLILVVNLVGTSQNWAVELLKLILDVNLVGTSQNWAVALLVVVQNEFGFPRVE
jgi:hypothetical protein